MENKILLKCPLFKGFDEEKLNNALKILSAKKEGYPKNTTIISAGTKSNRFGVVLEGIVQVSFLDIDGNSVLVANLPSGDTFGEALCWVETKESPFTITAFSDTEVLWLCPDKLREASSDETACLLKNNYLSLLAHKTLSMNNRVQILSKPTLRQKIITYLSQVSNLKGTKSFEIPFDRESLALYLGANRSALSRELSNMEKEGIIEFNKNTFVIK